MKEFKDAWANACKRAKVERQFKWLRNTSIEILEHAGIPRTSAKKFVGRKTDAVYEHYQIGSDERLRDHGELLSKFLEKKTDVESSQNRPRIDIGQRPGKQLKYSTIRLWK